MCWNDVAFCPNDCIKCLTERTVVDILIRENRVFPFGLTEVLLERYRKMRDHFLDSCVTHPDFWKQGDLRLADVKRYRDALLVIPATHSAIKGNDEWKDILKNPCVGHDLPVWMHGPKPCKNRRIMIVSQDPLRTGHGAGNLLLSTPFGFHSADYRDNDGDLLMQLALRLMGGGFVLYFTDAMKIYNRKPEPLKLNKKTKKEESPCKGCAHYDECMTRCNEVGISKRRIQRDFKTRYNTCLADEIRIFNPDVILTFGKSAAMTLFPTAFGPTNVVQGIGLNRLTFTNMVAPMPWRDHYSEIPTLSFLHPSRTNGNALKTIGGVDKFIEHCVDVVNDFFNKKGKTNEQR